MRRGRDAHGRAGRQAAWFRVTAAASSATLLGTLGLAGTSMAATGAAANAAKPAAATADTSCHLGNGVKHVVTLVFDNVHYFRDNPNVPSDLEQIPNLLNFFTSNGTFLSNNHTPLIAHTGDNILTTLTGLYGDRHGMPISNSYQAYNATRRDTDPAGSFAYWTDPVFDTPRPAEPRPRHQPEHGLLAGPAGHRGAPRGAGHRHPGALGAVHPGRLRRRRGGHGQPGAGEHRGRHPQGVRGRVAGRPAAERRPGLVQGRRGRGLRRRRRALRPGQRVLRRRQGREVRADRRVGDRGVRPAAGRAGRVQRVPGAVRPPVRRAAARRGHAEPVQPRRPRSPTPPGTWSTRTATRSTARSSPTTRASPGSARSTRRRAWPTWPTCWSPASPW